MHVLIAWCGFLGAWLLFGGPIYQAVIELREQEVRREDLAAMSKGVSQGPPVSGWWWLFPPMKFVLERRRSEAFRRAVLERLGPRELESLLNYFNKATGWAAVGAGGLLIAANETGNLAEHYEEHATWLFAGLFVLMVVIVVSVIVARVRASQRVLDAATPDS